MSETEDTDETEVEQFFQPYCRECEPAAETNKENLRVIQDMWVGLARTNKRTAERKKRNHDVLRHDGEDTAEVRTFESRSIGKLPREIPKIENDE